MLPRKEGQRMLPRGTGANPSGPYSSWGTSQLRTGLGEDVTQLPHNVSSEASEVSLATSILSEDYWPHT